MPGRYKQELEQDSTEGTYAGTPHQPSNAGQQRHPGRKRHVVHLSINVLGHSSLTSSDMLLRYNHVGSKRGKTQRGQAAKDVETSTRIPLAQQSRIHHRPSTSAIHMCTADSIQRLSPQPKYNSGTASHFLQNGVFSEDLHAYKCFYAIAFQLSLSFPCIFPF